MLDEAGRHRTTSDAAVGWKATCNEKAPGVVSMGDTASGFKHVSGDTENVRLWPGSSCKIKP